ncbi:hypothetical protein HT094_02285 [Shewanella sp. ZOR0012]|uniref:hypothetical protein n=1 Tax=Shewanella sp. ZOR0012 TaxID=1339231 RepID=UPI0006466EFB|nr:hypothetical protein [Shewanella sp. ZOR0012]NSM23266.1 hypothetical protein [Shewanella sp. ZOR0012]
MSNIGTEINPIILTPESSSPSLAMNDLYSKRDFLLECTRLGMTGQNIEDLNRDFQESNYVLNVISNPYLDANLVKMALFLYTKLDEEGSIFVVSRSEVDEVNLEYYGSDGNIYLKSRDGYVDVKPYNFNDIRILSGEIFDVLNMVLSFPRLTGSLRTLHRFSYITVTDINEHNTVDGVKLLREKLKNKKITSDKCHKYTLGRSPLKHIRISNYMRAVDLSDRWIYSE